MSKIAASLHARVQSLAAANPDTPAESASASEPSEAAPPVAAGSETESAPVDGDAEASTGEGGASAAPGASPEPTTDPAATRHALLAEKLAKVREDRQAAAREKRARELQSQAEADRKAAAEERAKYDGLKNGTFLETIKALGRDPKQAFQEMVDEAKRAGTPEAQIALMREQFKRELDETVGPLKKTIEELTKEREERDARERTARFEADFHRNLADPEFTELRIEYPDEKLYAFAEQFRREPATLFAHAKELGVRLTYSDGKFTMKDILNVLRCAHDEHEQGKKQRRERMQAPTTSQAAPQQAPANAKTVNGTAERRNAETNPLGNDTAASRAAGPGVQARLSKQQRIDRAINRDLARRG